MDEIQSDSRLLFFLEMEAKFARNSVSTGECNYLNCNKLNLTFDFINYMRHFVSSGYKMTVVFNKCQSIFGIAPYRASLLTGQIMGENFKSFIQFETLTTFI